MPSRDVVELHPARSRPSGGRDFALVVGVDHYPRFRDLRGAVADATAFHAWLCDPDGGSVDPASSRLITSTPSSTRPLQEQFDAALSALCEQAATQGGGRRLYLYFAGHGAMCTDTADDLALLLAAWSHEQSRVAVSSERYRRALATMGTFEELALFFDCCRRTTTAAVGIGPTFATPTEPSALARTFVAYATEAGHAATEDASSGTWHGAFTRSLLEILRREERGLEPAHLKSLLEHEARMHGQRAHVIDGLLAESTFGVRGTPPLFEVLPDDTFGELELFDGFGHRVAAHDSCDGTWSFPLRAGLYKLIYGAPRRCQQILDHASPTRLDFRPRLGAPIARSWPATDLGRALPQRSEMHELDLDRDLVELAPDVWIRRDGDCHRIEAPAGSLPYHGRISVLRGARVDDAAPSPVQRRQLRDGDLFACAGTWFLVGDVPDEQTYAGVRSAAEAARLPRPRTAVLRLASSADVAFVAYDAIGREVARGAGDASLRLPHGLYRIDTELFGGATSRIIELDDTSGSVRLERPVIRSPAIVIAGELDAHRTAAARLTASSTAPALGRPPHTSRLVIHTREGAAPVSVHDLHGQLLGDDHQALSCAIAPGTYVLRMRHDLAVTIPPGYTARCFVRGAGVRVSLAPVSASLYDHDRVARAMEHVITTGRLPPGGFELALREAAADLCFAVAAAHALVGDDRAALVSALGEQVRIPDVAILRGEVPFAPPLLRASLRMVMTERRFDLTSLASHAPLATAACCATGDPFWATWDPSPGSEAWLAPTRAALPSATDEHARWLAVPPGCLSGGE